MGSWNWCSIETACYCMSLVFSASPAAILSLLTDNMENTNGDANGEQDFDTLQLRNRTVTETLSPVEDLGQNKKEENGKEQDKEKYDTLTLRNRTVTETLSEVKDFGQNKKEDEKNGSSEDAKKGDEEANADKFDKLELKT